MKVWNYVVIMVGTMMVLELAGIDLGSAEIFGLLGISFNGLGEIAAVSWSFSNFVEALFGNAGLLTAVTTTSAAVAVGFFTNAKKENLVILPFITGTLTLFFQTNAAIMNRMIATGDVWAATLMILFLAPFSFGFVVALLEFFRGTD